MYYLFYRQMQPLWLWHIMTQLLSLERSTAHLIHMNKIRDNWTPGFLLDKLSKAKQNRANRKKSQKPVNHNFRSLNDEKWNVYQSDSLAGFLPCPPGRAFWEIQFPFHQKKKKEEKKSRFHFVGWLCSVEETLEDQTLLLTVYCLCFCGFSYGTASSVVAFQR